MGSFGLFVLDMKRVIVVILSVQLLAGFSKGCECHKENLLLNRLDKLNEDIAKLVRDDLHFDGSHVAALGPSDFMSNGFMYRKKRSEDDLGGEKRAFGGWMNREQRAFGGWKNRNKRSFGAWKNRNRRGFGGWIDRKRNMDNWDGENFDFQEKKRDYYDLGSDED